MGADDDDLSPSDKLVSAVFAQLDDPEEHLTDEEWLVAMEWIAEEVADRLRIARENVAKQRALRVVRDRGDR